MTTSKISQLGLTGPKPTDEVEFKVGDIVFALNDNAGEYPLLVQKVLEDGSCEVVWFTTYGFKQTHQFSKAELVMSVDTGPEEE